jgi:cation transport ATPase
MHKLILLLILIPSVALANVIEVKVLGLVCSACGIGIKKHLLKTKKVKVIKLDTEKHLTYIYLLKNKNLTDREIHKAIKNAGYEVSKITRPIKNSQ